MPSHERAEILPPFERSIVLAEGVMGNQRALAGVSCEAR